MIKRLAFIAIIAWLAWATWQHHTTPAIGEAVEATEAPEVAGVPIEEVIPQKPPKVRTGEAVKRRLNLSEVDIKNPDWVVAAASVVKADDHPHEVITEFNKATGEFKTVDVTKAKPWLDPTTKGDAMIAAGPNAAGGQTGLFQVRQGILNVKDFTLGVVGQISYANGTAGGTTDEALMAAAWYTWGR